MLSFDFAQKRATILALIRRFFTQQNFLEVDTPLLVRVPGMEPYLDVFCTEFVFESGTSLSSGQNFSQSKKICSSKQTSHLMYLITSPEYAMKRLLAQGYTQVFQLNKCFRNKETGGSLHNPEFTMLEWYRTKADYRDIMKDTEKLLCFLVQKLFRKNFFMYQGNRIDVSKCEIVTLQQLFQHYTGMQKADFEEEKKFRQYCISRYAKVWGKARLSRYTFDDLFFLVFLNEIEPHLGLKNPVIVKDYPVSMAALAKLSRNKKYAERFELYIAGVELANAFSELNDVKEQRRRLQAERLLRKKLGKLDYDLDEKFLEAVGNMPRAGGIALGVDRLVMLLLDAKCLQDVIFFPFEEV